MSAPTTFQWLCAAVRRVDTGSRRRTAYLLVWTLHRARRAKDTVRGWLGEGGDLGWWLRLAVLVAAAAVLRKVAVALGSSLYERVSSGAAPWLPWGAVTWWIISAYRAGADDWKPKRPAAPPPPADGQEQPDSGDEQQPAPAAEQPATPPISPIELVAAVRDVGTPHAQLKPLAEHLRTTTDAVRAAAAGVGWPVKDVRMQGRSASAGLRWDEAPSAEQAYPSPGVVGAGQPADDNDDDRARPVFIADETNPVRTHVVWRDR